VPLRVVTVVLVVALVTLGSTAGTVAATQRPVAATGLDSSLAYDVSPTGSELPGAAVSARDGGLFVAGSAEAATDGQFVQFVLRLGPDGAEEWLWTSDHFGEGHSLAQTTDGGVVVGGRASPVRPFGNEMSVTKVSAGGEQVWHRTFFDGRAGEIRAVTATPDGGVVAAGRGLGGDARTAFVTRLDADGATVWERPLHDGAGYSVRDALTVSDGFVLVGSTGRTGDDLADGFATKLDADGATVWERTVDHSDLDWFLAVDETDAGVVVAGRTGGESGRPTVWVLELDADGVVTTDARFERTADEGRVSGDRVADVVARSDGSYLVATAYSSRGSVGQGSVPALVSLVPDGDGLTAGTMHVYAADTFGSPVAVVERGDGLLAVNSLRDVRVDQIRVGDPDRTTTVWLAGVGALDGDTADGDVPVAVGGGGGGGGGLATVALAGGVVVSALLAAVVGFAVYRRRRRRGPDAPGGSAS
jgi:hypothetical protein